LADLGQRKDLSRGSLRVNSSSAEFHLFGHGASVLGSGRPQPPPGFSLARNVLRMGREIATNALL
jgi:hypothetical protein